MDTQGAKQFLKSRMWEILSVIVYIIIASTILQQRVYGLEEKLTSINSDHQTDVVELRQEVNSLKSVNNEILQRLSSIDAKLQLIIDGKIKLKD